MQLDEFMRTGANKFGALGRGFMMNPEAGTRGEELGLDFFQYYALGRGGVLGDVDGKTVADTFYFFNPELVSSVWDAGTQKQKPAEVSKHYAGAVADWGRRALEGIDDLDAFAGMCDRIAAGAEASPSSSLFDAWRKVDLPEDAPGRAAAHFTLVLREHRGGAHVDAIKQVGLSPLEAVAVNTPAMLQIFGWTDPPTDTDALKDRAKKAEQITDELCAPAFAGLSDEERDTFARVINEIVAKLGV
jgi:hypothetical protein